MTPRVLTTNVMSVGKGVFEGEAAEEGIRVSQEEEGGRAKGRFNRPAGKSSKPNSHPQTTNPTPPYAPLHPLSSNTKRQILKP
jgi:hypothetical protein